MYQSKNELNSIQIKNSCCNKKQYTKKTRINTGLLSDKINI
jgi:hypothetical protein